MPGAWELPRPEVLVAILNARPVTLKWAFSLRNIKLPPGHSISCFSGMPFDHARNEACKMVLNHGYQWLFFLDDDVIIPPDSFFRMASKGVDIISGLYIRRNEPILPVALNDTNPKPTFITDFRPGDVFEADLVGAGCLLIHRRVLERMKPPWFEWMVDREDLPENQRSSEDFAFCRKAKKEYGFKIYVDSSVQCHHVGYGRSDVTGAFRPLES